MWGFGIGSIVLDNNVSAVFLKLCFNTKDTKDTKMSHKEKTIVYGMSLGTATLRI